MPTNKHFVNRFLAIGLLMAATGTVSAQRDDLTPVPNPPEPPERVRSGEVLEPDVRIIAGKQRTITEYRVNGVLRAVKVAPKNAPEYYLVDADGDGELESRRGELDADFWIAQWVLYSW